MDFEHNSLFGGGRSSHRGLIPHNYRNGARRQVLGRDSLADSQDVSLAILEPRSLCPVRVRDAVLHLDPRWVILFEYHASGLELTNFGGDVIHRPERGARL